MPHGESREAGRAGLLQKELTQHWERPSCNKAPKARAQQQSTKAPSAPRSARPAPARPADPAASSHTPEHTHTACCAPLLPTWLISPLLWAGCGSSSFLSSFPAVCSCSHLSSAWFRNSNLLCPAISMSHLLPSPLPVSRIASPAGQCLCLSLNFSPSTVALKIFPPLLYLHHHTPAHSLAPAHPQPLFHQWTCPGWHSALGKAGRWPGKDKEPKIQDSSLWNHLAACQQGKTKVFLLTNSNL